MHSHALLERFRLGFARFRATWYDPANNRYAELRAGQAPFAAVIACSDSRVDPVQILDARPGELFVIRNVANLVPPHEPDTHHHGVSSALEYAIRHLGVGHVIVMGHAHCGGFAGLLNEQEGEDDTYLKVWMDQARLVKTEVDRALSGGSPEERQRACEMGGIRLSLRHLRSFPWVRDALERGTLCLHGLYFDLDGGELLSLCPETGVFLPLAASAPFGSGARLLAR